MPFKISPQNNELAHAFGLGLLHVFLAFFVFLLAFAAFIHWPSLAPDRSTALLIILPLAGLAGLINFKAGYRQLHFCYQNRRQDHKTPPQYPSSQKEISQNEIPQNEISRGINPNPPQSTGHSSIRPKTDFFALSLMILVFISMQQFFA